MSFLQLALLGFTSGMGFAAVVASLMAGYFAARHSLTEL